MPLPFRPAAVFEVGQSPTIKEAQAIADDIFADFVSQARDPACPVTRAFMPQRCLRGAACTRPLLSPSRSPAAPLLFLVHAGGGQG